MKPRESDPNNGGAAQKAEPVRPAKQDIGNLIERVEVYYRDGSRQIANFVPGDPEVSCEHFVNEGIHGAGDMRLQDFLAELKAEAEETIAPRCWECHRKMTKDEIGDEFPQERTCNQCAGISEDPKAGDVCTQCGKPIEHKEPHTICDQCREKNG